MSYKKLMRLARVHAWRVLASGALLSLALWWGLGGLGIVPAAVALLMWCR